MIDSDMSMIAAWAAHRHEKHVLHEMLGVSTDSPELVQRARYTAALANWVEVFMTIPPQDGETLH